MAMSVQRQADQYDLETPTPAPRYAQHEVADMLRSGRRIQAGTLDTREAAGNPDLDSLWMPEEEDPKHPTSIEDAYQHHGGRHEDPWNELGPMLNKDTEVAYPPELEDSGSAGPYDSENVKGRPIMKRVPKG